MGDVSFIYEIKNNENGKFYIGSTKDVDIRFRAHKNQLNNNTHVNTYLQNAWNKHGEKSFSFNIIEEVPRDVQFETEQGYLDALQPFNSIGYNIATSVVDFSKRTLQHKKCRNCAKDFDTYYSHQVFCSDDCCNDVHGWKDKSDWIFNKRVSDSHFKYEYSAGCCGEPTIEDWMHALIVDQMEK